MGCWRPAAERPHLRRAQVADDPDDPPRQVEQEENPDEAKDRGDTATVTTLQVAIEDVEDFRRTLEAIERGDDPRHRIRCRWKDETEAGRPGPYAPDIDDGVKVNIRPFQESGLLPAKVISKW